MTQFNSPSMHNQNNEGQIKRYVHQPLTVDHYGTKVQIHTNGRVTITKVADTKGPDNEIEFDEIDVPASLIFKVAGLLKATRNITYVTVGDPTEQK